VFLPPFLIRIERNNKMDKKIAKDGDMVKVLYKGTFEDGSLFDASDESKPFEFTIGKEMVLPAFEKAVVGLEVGKEKNISIPPEEAYGEPNAEMFTLIGRDQLPEGLEPKIGMTLRANADENTVINVRITEIKDDTITVDANHPLAGKELNFEIKLVEIVSQGA